MDIQKDPYNILSDIAGLSIFSNLKKSPLITGFANLLEMFVKTCPRRPSDREDGRSKPRGYDAGRRISRRASEHSLTLIAAWASFIEALLVCPQNAEAASAQSDGLNQRPNTVFCSAIASLVLADRNPFSLSAQTADGALSPLLLALTQADLVRLERIAGFDISALGFHIAGFLHKTGFEQAASDIEAASRALWSEEGKNQNDHQPADWAFSAGSLADFYRRRALEE
jgi:hypothetical protein